MKREILGVHAWGLLLLAGIYLAMWVGARRMRAGGITGRHMLFIGTIALAGGIAGGMLLHLAQYGRFGMVSYGGWTLAIAGVLLYVRARGLPVARVADMLAPALAVGEAVGRLGCLLNGCCYGDVCALPWGVRFPAMRGELAIPFEQFFDGLALHSAGAHQVLASYPYPPLHPTQLYAAAAGGAVFVALLLWDRHKRFDGETALAFGLLYSATRFLVELPRNDTPLLAAGGLTMGQTLAVPFFLGCLGLWVYFRCRAKR